MAMDTSTQDAPVDLSSIVAIRKQMYRRWLPFYASLVLKFVPLALLCGLGVHWLIRWLLPRTIGVSPFVLPIAFGLAALLICLWTLPAMLRLDRRIDQELTRMAQRVSAGETVHSSEMVTYAADRRFGASPPNTSLERTRER
jgi:hypothetical protein